MAPTEVARRLGHSVAVLLRVYANCIDGQEDAVNDRIAAALAGRPHGTLAEAQAAETEHEPDLRTTRGPEQGET